MIGAKYALHFRSPALLVLLAAASSSLAMADAKKEKKQESFSIVAGTVFRPPGFALGGAEVTLKPESGKVQRSVSNTRGEFAFRVPSRLASYTVRVKADGFEVQEKTTEIGIDQRIDLAFELNPVRKK